MDAVGALLASGEPLDSRDARRTCPRQPQAEDAATCGATECAAARAGGSWQVVPSRGVQCLTRLSHLARQAVRCADLCTATLGRLCLPQRQAGCRTSADRPTFHHAEALRRTEAPHVGDFSSEIVISAGPPTWVQTARLAEVAKRRRVLLRRRPDSPHVLPADGCHGRAAARVVLEDGAAAPPPTCLELCTASAGRERLSWPNGERNSAENHVASQPIYK